MAVNHFYVLVYDIASDRRRAKIARLLEASAERVQHSVFEAWLVPLELEKLMKKTQKHLNEKEDSLRVYMLCGECQEKVKTWGVGKMTGPPELLVV